MGIDLIVAICDIKGMSDINSYIEAERPKKMGEIAEQIGVSRTYLYQLESGDRYPSLKLAISISKATDGRVAVSSWANLAEVQAALSAEAAQ